MKKEDVVHSEPVPTSKEHSVPAGIEGIVLSNFDIKETHAAEQTTKQYSTRDCTDTCW